MAALGTALSVERSAAQDDGLFSGVESAVARGLPAAGPGNTPGIATVRSRLVRVAGQRLATARDVAAVAGAVEPGDASTLTLNLFADTVLTGIVERTGPTASGTGYVLAGPLDGIESGTMTLLVYEEGMLGMVRTPTATYSIRPLGEGVHAVSQIASLGSGLRPGLPDADRAQRIRERCLQRDELVVRQMWSQLCRATPRTQRSPRSPGCGHMRFSRCCTTSFAIPGSTNSPHRNSSCSVNCCSSSKNSPASARLMPKRSARCVNNSPVYLGRKTDVNQWPAMLVRPFAA